MQRKHKLILIIFTSVIFAYFIYFFNLEDKIYLVSLGDGVSSGETAYNIDGISYNDYLKEYYEEKNLLRCYNKTFSYKNYKIENLLNDLKNNILDSKNKLYIDQIIHKADLITINIGEDELTKLSITNDLDEEYIKKYIKNYNELLTFLKEITNAKIVVIGLYENDYLSKSDVIIINSEISNIVLSHEQTFINVSDLLIEKDYYFNNSSYYFNYKGHETIAEIIIHSL